MLYVFELLWFLCQLKSNVYMRISFTTYNHEITRNYFLANQKQSHSSKILVFFCKSFMIVLKRALEFIYLFFANWGLFVCDFCFYLNTFVFSRSTGNWIGNWQGSFRWKQRSAFDLSYSWESNSYGKSSFFGVHH